MNRLPNLKKKSLKLHEDIRKILINNYRFDEPLIKRLDKLNSVAKLREELAVIEREIRELEVVEYSRAG